MNLLAKASYETGEYSSLSAGYAVYGAGPGSGTTIKKWRDVPVLVSVIRYNHQDKSTSIMPVRNYLNREFMEKDWDNILSKARTYEYAEQQEGLYVNWPKSLYKAFQTNTFIRYISGGLMHEMDGWHPGNMTPSQNTEYPYTFYSSHLPRKK